MNLSDMQDFQSMREMFDCIGIRPELQSQILEVIQANMDCWDQMQVEHRLAALGSTLELFNPAAKSNHAFNAKVYLEGLMQLARS